jgi:PilX N-terminal
MERGVALVIVLILLAILTMLAIAGASTATAELVMAGNEQYREHAADAASAGIEQAIARLGPASGPETFTRVTNGYTAVAHYLGDESSLPQWSAEKFIGRHYAIDSTGRSLRGAVDAQTQGVLIVVPTAGTDTFNRIGSGLTGDSGP